jgi:phosphopantothenoylcysteine decarboxylase/phosphopantothenate--cysteine ligase
MREAVLRASAKADALVMAAAVADFRPAEPAGTKLKKGAKTRLALPLIATEDILAEVGARRKKSRRPRVLVGFAAETGDPTDEARRKLVSKGLDLVVANDVTSPGAAFASPENRVVLIDRRGATPQPLMGKDEVAALVMERVAAALGVSGSGRR